MFLAQPVVVFDDGLVLFGMEELVVIVLFLHG
jgi:hypothetical protein